MLSENRGLVAHNHLVTVDWNKDSPEVKVQGAFTLDMLNGLYEMGLLDSTSPIAHQYKAAAKAEVRSPLMSPFDDEYDPDYTFAKSSADYSRANIRRKGGLGVGDVCTLEPNARYDGMLSDLREAVGLGALPMEDALRHLPKIAALTLDGALPSPYPSGPLALAQAYAAEAGSDAGDIAVPDKQQSAALTEKVFKERVRNVTQDFVGPGRHLVIPKPGIVEAAEPGESQPVTPGKLVGQLEEEWAELSKKRDIKNLEADLAFFHGRENAQPSHKPFTADELSNLVDRTEQQQLKEEKEKKITALIPYSQLIPISGGADATFFGVTHKGIVEDAWGNTVDYQSRNPLFDKPRAIPAGLQRILDEEECNKDVIVRRKLERPVIEGRF